MKTNKNEYKKPYEWGCMERYPQKLFANIEYDRSPLTRYAYNGFKWPENLPEIVKNSDGFVLSPPYKYCFYVKGSSEDLLKYDCIDNMASSPLVNQKLQDLIAQFCKDDVQFLDAEIKTKDKILTSEYKLVNILAKVDAIDMDESDYWTNDYKRYEFGKVYFKENSMKGHHIARDRMDDHLIVISKELKDILKKNKIKGLKFVTDERAYLCTEGVIEPILNYYGEYPEYALYRLKIRVNNSDLFFTLKRKLNRIPLYMLDTLVPQLKDLSEEGQKNLEELKLLMEERRKKEAAMGA